MLYIEIHDGYLYNYHINNTNSIRLISDTIFFLGEYSHLILK